LVEVRVCGGDFPLIVACLEISLHWLPPYFIDNMSVDQASAELTEDAATTHSNLYCAGAHVTTTLAVATGSGARQELASSTPAPRDPASGPDHGDVRR